MSDDNKVAEATETKVETKSQLETAQPKVYEESYVKELIADRDKAKAKAREYAELEKKAKEAKSIEDGNIKDVLAQREAELAEARKMLEVVETARQARRTEVLSKITDPGLKEFAEKLSSAEEVERFIALVADKKLTTHTSKDKTTAPEAPEFTTLRDMMTAQAGGGLRTKL